MDSMDDMDTSEFEAIDPASTPAPPRGRWRWSGRTKRVATSIAAGAVLLGSGAGIGVALTGGASASTGGASAGTPSASTSAAAHSAAARCAKLEQQLRGNGHPTAANRLLAFCTNPLVRLALVGGEHGEVTFQTKSGAKTAAFERGTIQAVSSSGITVAAPDGTTWIWTFTSNMRVQDAGQQVTTAKLSNGQQVLVIGQALGTAHNVRLIRIRNASGS